MRAYERLAFTGFIALLLGPIVAQGLWRPLAHFLGQSGTAEGVTEGALVIGGATVGIRILSPDRSSWLSRVLGLFVAAGVTFGLSPGPAGLITLLVVAAAMEAVVLWLPGRLPAALDGLANRHKRLTALYVLVALLTLFSTLRVSIFMGDPTRVDCQVIPGDDFLARHSCLSAYVHACSLSQRHVENLYDVRWYAGSEGQEPLPPGAINPYHPFILDYYAYPPPFLLGMLPIYLLDGDFLAQRALWFGINGVLLALSLWVVSSWVQGPKAHRVLLLSPIFMGSLPVLATLQTGNVQLAVVAMSILAMVLFENERPVLGGALLAFAILAKISPGVLGIVLLAQRRWRDALWTAGFGIVLIGATALASGIEPLWSFLTYTLPRLSSGEAFSFMDDRDFSIWTNLAPFGWPFKLNLIGIHVGDPWALGRTVGHAYTASLVLMVALATRQPEQRHERVLSWMSVLVLSALQSPFAPGYVLIGLLWATAIWSVEVKGSRGGVGLVLLSLGLTVVPPFSMPVKVAYSLFSSVLVLSVSSWLILRPKGNAMPGSSSNGAGSSS